MNELAKKLKDYIALDIEVRNGPVHDFVMGVWERYRKDFEPYGWRLDEVTWENDTGYPYIVFSGHYRGEEEHFAVHTSFFEDYEAAAEAKRLDMKRELEAREEQRRLKEKQDVLDKELAERKLYEELKAKYGGEA